MSNHTPIFMPGDRVFYVGSNERIKAELTTKEGKPYIGWIHAPVQNVEDKYVVEFPDTKEGDSYLMWGSNLSHHRPAKTDKVEGPEIQPRRRKKDADTE